MSRKRVVEERQVAIMFHHVGSTYVFQVPQDIFDDKFKDVCEAALSNKDEARVAIQKMCVGTEDTPYSPGWIEAEEDKARRKQMEEENELIERDRRNYKEFKPFLVAVVESTHRSFYMNHMGPVYVFSCIEDDTSM